MHRELRKRPLGRLLALKIISRDHWLERKHQGGKRKEEERGINDELANFETEIKN